ncbi:MAG TPA: OsmC family protein [Gemmatimonadaceae bacterium]
MDALTATPAGPVTKTHTHAVPFQVALTLTEGYAFDVDPLLPGVAPFTIDESPPLGTGRGPNPARVLASALAGCLGASLLFSMRKMRIDVRDLTVRATGTMTRNERGRLRVGSIQVDLTPTVAAADLDRLARCVATFEDYCVVTQSVRPALEVMVNVMPSVI